MNGKPWTKEEIELFRRLYPDRPTAEVARILNRSIKSCYSASAIFGVRKSESFHKKLMAIEADRLRKYGQRTRFKKGQKTWNTGMKGLRFPGSEKGYFKTGHLPHNTKHDGAISIRMFKTGHRGNKRPYKYIRLAQGNWRELHLHVWESHHGPIPKGMRICFKDNDSLNCDITNLEMLTAQEAAGRLHMSDEFIAMKLSQASVRGKGKGKYEKKLFEKLLKQPDLLEAKRKQLLLNKTIKERS